MKKVLSIALALAMIFSLAACGSKDEATVDESLPIYSQGLTSDGTYDIKALDYVTLPEFTKDAFDGTFWTVSQDDIDEQMYNFGNQYATTNEVTNRSIVDGDYVNIDYSGYMNGEQFEGGTAEGQTVLAGSTQFIDDFLTQIIGHLPGDEFDVDVTFPDPYDNNPDFAGKDATFKVKINYIEETIQPEITDAFVKEKAGEDLGVNTIEELEDYIEGMLLDNQRTTAIDQFLLDSAVVTEIPEVVLKHQENLVRQGYADTASQYGMDVDTLVTYSGYESLDALIEASYSDIEDMAKKAMMYQACAESFGIKIANTDVADYFEDVMGTREYSAYSENFGMPYLKFVAMAAQVVDEITEIVEK